MDRNGSGRALLLRTFVAFLLAAAIWFLLHTGGEPLHAAYYAVLLLGSAFFIRSKAAYGVVVFVAISGFGAVLFSHGFDESWLQAGIPLLLAAILGGIILSTRLGSMPGTSRLHHGDEMQKISTDQEQMDRMKDELISVMGHELKTPLASIHGSLRLIEGMNDGSLPPKVHHLVKIASRNSDRLTQLVNDLLDVERMRAGRLELDPVEVDARAVVHDAVLSVGELAKAKGVGLVEDGEPVALRVDRERLVQALTNLLSNAVKYSSAGGKVEVRTRAEKDQVRFEVQDEGPGIPRMQHGRLFQRFSQLDSSDSRKNGGSGLGLMITKSIAEAHGGEVGLESTEGEGSTFFILLPVGSTKRAKARLMG